MDRTLPDVQAVDGTCPTCGHYDDAWEEKQAEEAVRAAAADLMEAARPIWRYGNGEGGYVVEILLAAALDAGLPVPQRREFQQRPEVERLAARDGWCCHYCEAKLCGHPDLPWPHVEHVVPKSKGGGEGLGNKVLACPPCNAAKGTRTYEEFTGSAFVMLGGPDR